MQSEELAIEAAGVPGYPRPRRARLGLRRARLRPDVMAQDGRRAIFGIALNRQQIHEPYVPDELDAYARKCRMLVICVAREVSEKAIDVLFQTPTPHWRKMRLLRYPGTKLEEVSKAADQKTLRDLVRARGDAAVHLLADED